MRRLASIALALMLLGAAASGVAGGLPPVETPGAAQALFVELVVNGQAGGAIVPLSRQGGRLLVAAPDLRAAGIAYDLDGAVDVNDLPGITATYEASTQRLLLDVTPDKLPLSHIAGSRRARIHGVADTGLLLSYDLYAQRADGQSMLSAWSEQRLFGAFGMLSTTGVLRSAQSGGRIAGGYLRYDTRYRRVDEDRALALTVGDLVTNTLAWSNSVRIGGLQIARDYRVRPDLVTMPLPSFSGKVALPSAVDLFIDGYRQQSADVAPGRFVLDNIPVITGAGEATVVTTDAVGRQVRTVIPFYVTSQLLRPGLVDFGVEIGALRRHYGLSSFNYGEPVLSLTGRRGMTERLTVESHAELSQRFGLAGAGLLWQPGLWGVVNVAASASRMRARSGRQLLASYSYTGQRLGFQLQHVERSDGYRDLSNFDLWDYSGMRSASRAVATFSLGAHGSFGAAFIDQKAFAGPRARLASLSYSRSIRDSASVFISADRDLANGTTSAQLRLMLPFGRNGLSAGISRSGGRDMLYQADYARAVPSHGGIGIVASAATSGEGRAYGQASATWRTRAMQIELGASVAGGRSSIWAGMTGSVASMDGNLFVANQVSDAFAVVSTEGVGDVPVYFENQLLGRTDRSGHLFVPQVTSHQPSLFALDPLVLGVGHTLALAEKRVAVRSGAGAVVRIPITPAHAVTVTLLDAGGMPLAAGSDAVRSDGGSTVVGWDGVVFLDRATARIDLDVARRDGGRCRAEVNVPADAEALAQLAPVRCL